MSHRPHAIASRPRSSRPSGSDAVAWTADIAQRGSGKGAAERLLGIEPHRVRVGDSSMRMSVSFSGCTQHYRQPQ
jgi:hypothetical protein